MTLSIFSIGPFRHKKGLMKSSLNEIITEYNIRSNK